MARARFWAVRAVRSLYVRWQYVYSGPGLRTTHRSRSLAGSSCSPDRQAVAVAHSHRAHTNTARLSAFWGRPHLERVSCGPVRTRPGPAVRSERGRGRNHSSAGRPRKFSPTHPRHQFIAAWKLSRALPRGHNLERGGKVHRADRLRSTAPKFPGSWRARRAVAADRWREGKK
ncbi:hypothetical protein BC628DRAFT_1384724 [Trametes gibbosa]|nr:hypothetical protein BC628DRAFT_1384724 [Trametes gibbosa]